MTDGAEQQLAALLGRFRAITAATQGMEDKLDSPRESADQRGVVTVTVEGRQRRINQVVIAANWRDKVGPGGLGQAVTEAVMTAQLEPIGELFQAIAEAPDEVADSAELPRPATTPGAGIDIQGLSEMLTTVDGALDAVGSSSSGAGVMGDQGAPQSEVIGRAAGGSIEVRLMAGSPSSITVDEEWAAKTSRQKLSEFILAAFQAAYDQDSEQKPHDSGLADELQSIVDRVGLTPPDSFGRQNGEG